MFYLLYSEEEKTRMIRMKNYSFLMIGLLFFLLLVGCKQINQFSPEQVITNALKTDNQFSFYGEMVMTTKGLNENENMFIKEWRHNNKSRIEMEVDGELIIAVNDNQSMILYEENQNKVIKIEDGDLEEIHPKEQVEMLLDMIRDTHDIET